MSSLENGFSFKLSILLSPLGGTFGGMEGNSLPGNHPFFGNIPIAAYLIDVVSHREIPIVVVILRSIAIQIHVTIFPYIHNQGPGAGPCAGST